MRFISIAFALSLILIVLILWPQNNIHESSTSFSEACAFVKDRIFLDMQIVEPWYRRCLHLARNHRHEKLHQQRYYLRQHLESLNVSHLDLYEPQEVETIWTENKRSTGIMADFIDGQLVVMEIKPGSSGQKMGLQMGDQILLINGEAPSPHLAQTLSGEYVLDRKGKRVHVSVAAQELIIDEKWKVLKQSERTARLWVPSFRGDYFGLQDLTEIAKQISPYKKIILDLRKNQGGNFVAGLRLLSLFFCGPQHLGYLIRPKFPELPKVNLPDDLSDTKQLELMNQSYYVNLQTYSNYPCLTQSLSVLVDHETASTAEMVAQALKDYRGALILGNPSGGKLLVGVWYPMENLGKGVKISIPEAIYQTKRGRQIENNGVHLDEVLEYRRVDFERGLDTWLGVALTKF